MLCCTLKTCHNKQQAMIIFTFTIIRCDRSLRYHSSTPVVPPSKAFYNVASCGTVDKVQSLVESMVKAAAADM